MNRQSSSGNNYSSNKLEFLRYLHEEKIIKNCHADGRLSDETLATCDDIERYLNYDIMQETELCILDLQARFRGRKERRKVKQALGGLKGYII